MTTDEITNILMNAGLKIRRYKGTFFWKNRCINYNFPPVCKIPYSAIKQIRSIRWKHLITVVYSDTRFKNTSEFMLQTDHYSLEDFDRKVRNRLRKSIQTCTFKRPTLAELQQYGLQINCQTCQRQHRSDFYLTDKSKWGKFINTVYSREDFCILGAYYQNRMVGYIVSYSLKEKQIMLLAYIDRKDSDITCPMNGLIYSLVNALLEINGSVNLSYGIESFVALPELNRFKANMLFRRIPGSRIYLLNPCIVPIIAGIVFFVVAVMKRKHVHSPFLQKTIRLYQGYRLYYKEKRNTHT